MFSTSVPVYLDHPNWNQEQQPDHQLQGYCDNQNYELELPPPPQVGGGSAPIKANSTADRARQAKLPQPEAGLKCPRCESANTKFCYFNNYNLSQPRHFCKTCRRYWTRGGSLRNIPVGGGCRKNKRCKNKSSSKSHHHHQAKKITNSAGTSAPSRRSAETPNYFLTPPPQLQMPFTDGIQNCGGGNLGIGGFQPKIATELGGGGEACLGFQSGSSDFLSVGVAEQWRLPFLTGLESSRADFFLYQGHEDVEARSGNSIINHLQAPVKLEENQLGLNLYSSDQFWGGNQWPEISGLNPSSTSNLL